MIQKHLKKHVNHCNTDVYVKNVNMPIKLLHYLTKGRKRKIVTSKNTNFLQIPKIITNSPIQLKWLVVWAVAGYKTKFMSNYGISTYDQLESLTPGLYPVENIYTDYHK